jgi:hypothetical protein
LTVATQAPSSRWVNEAFRDLGLTVMRSVVIPGNTISTGDGEVLEDRTLNEPAFTDVG